MIWDERGIRMCGFSLCPAVGSVSAKLWGDLSRSRFVAIVGEFDRRNIPAE
jgi:hypothetical protein